MNTLNKLFSLSIVLVLTSNAFSQATKRAFLMGIGDYPQNTSLNQTQTDLSSLNDLKILHVLSKVFKMK